MPQNAFPAHHQELDQSQLNEAVMRAEIAASLRDREVRMGEGYLRKLDKERQKLASREDKEAEIRENKIQ